MTEPASDPVPTLASADSAAANSPAVGTETGWWQDVRVLWFLVACFCFVGMYRGLWDADESRYAQIPREMLAHHTWLIPTLDGFTYLEKPPLAYWPTELLYMVFGVHAWVARLVPGLFFLGTLTLVYDFCRRFFGREIAYAAAGMLLFQPLFGFLGLEVLTDGPLTFWLTLALVSVGRIRLNPQSSRWWVGVFWLGCLGAFFTKALIGLAFPIGILVLDILVRGNVRHLARMAISLVLGGLVTFAVCGQWLYSMSAQVPGFPHYFFITQHWDRFTGHQHGGNWFLFLIALPAFSLPWWPLLWPTLKTAWRSLRTARQVANQPATGVGTAAVERPAYADVRGFLFLWFFSIFGFFSLSHGQLITYFLPAIPPLVMLLAVEFHTAQVGFQRRCVLFAWKSGWLLAVALVALLLSIGNADKLKVEMTSGPVSAVVGGVLLILANLLFYLLMGHRFLPRKPGRDPLMPYMMLLLATALGVGYATPNVGSAPVLQSEMVARVAKADPQYLAVHWSEHVTESDRAAGLYFVLDREVIHIGRAVVPSEQGDPRCELMYCLGQTEPALAKRLLYPSWPAFRQAVLELPTGATGAAGVATRQVLVFVPRDREIEVPADLGPVEPPQIVGRYLVYHLTTNRPPEPVPAPAAAEAQP